MSLALTGFHIRNELPNHKKESCISYETNPFHLRDRSSGRPPGGLGVRPRLAVQCRENVAGDLKDFTRRSENFAAVEFARGGDVTRSHDLHSSRAHGCVSRPFHSRSAGQSERAG
jgi:hypothetical protein